MEDNVHEVVRLLIARMGSHPEEFRADAGAGPVDAPVGDRWWRAKRAVEDYGTDEEKAAVRTAMRSIMLASAHEWMMDELLNGEERRREWREKEVQATTLAHQTMMAKQQAYTNQYASPSLYANQLTGTATTGTVSNVSVSENLIERLRKKGWV